MIDFTAPVVTRDGRPVRILCIDGHNPDFPVVGFMQGNSFPQTWTRDGKNGNDYPDADDLGNAPDPLWVNLRKRRAMP